MSNPNKQEFDSRQLFTLQVGELEELINKCVQRCLSENTPSQVPSKEMEDELIPRLDLAQRFKVSTVTLDKWVKYKQLPKPIKQGGRVYFLRSAISKWINEKGGSYDTL